MRTSEERINELHRRMDAMNVRRYRLVTAASFAACLLIVVIMAVVVSRLPLQQSGENVVGAMASIFAEQAYLGYIVIAILAFCLGSMVTVFCFRIRKQMLEK